MSEYGTMKALKPHKGNDCETSVNMCKSRGVYVEAPFVIVSVVVVKGSLRKYEIWNGLLAKATMA